MFNKPMITNMQPWQLKREIAHYGYKQTLCFVCMEVLEKLQQAFGKTLFTVDQVQKLIQQEISTWVDAYMNTFAYQGEYQGRVARLRGQYADELTQADLDVIRIQYIQELTRDVQTYFADNKLLELIARVRH